MTERTLKAIGAVFIIMAISVGVGGVVGSGMAWLQTTFLTPEFDFQTIAPVYTVLCSVSALVAFMTAILSDW